MHSALEPADPSKTIGRIAPLPRREQIKVMVGDGDLPQMRFVSFERKTSSTLRRFLDWLDLLLYYYLRVGWDALLRRDSPTRRATRLRQGFEYKGGTFIKLGVHLSMRVDLMPWYFSNELSGMVDHMPPYDISLALEALERCFKKPITAVFAQFDPVPIISTCTSCTYQGLLHSGEKVAVKVRRPGVGEQFMADIEALNWLVTIAEFLTIFRPALTRGLCDEIRSYLMEELDFVQEARRQDSFRRAAEKTGKQFFSAPRVFLEYSGEEVVINTFASGLWMWELLSAIEAGDESVLAQARAMDIQPASLARHLLWVNYWAREENLFFPADPNSNNIIVGPGSKLYFINFTNTGTLSHSRRQAMRQILAYAWQRDPQNMARSSLILMEPLPPVDVIELTQQLETYNWQMLYAMEATPGSISWQERTSVVQWMGIVHLARKHGIVLDIEVLRLMRSTLQFESMAVRLDPTIDFIAYYREFVQYKAEHARRRITESLTTHLDGRENEQLIIRIDRISQTLRGLFDRASHLLALPSVNFNVLIGKWPYAIYIIVRGLIQSLAVSVLALLVAALVNWLGGHPAAGFGQLMNQAFLHPIYHISLVLLLLVNGRTLLFRLDDKEV
ncbi:MAG: AarF/ABC1/UbiB kinase family protein [Chloroflexi bacterium]|nr:AarF/ABC1/UbiB kinase family protein [Chloroflexota bacterium]